MTFETKLSHPFFDKAIFMKYSAMQLFVSHGTRIKEDSTMTATNLKNESSVRI